jgi:hypothetical protein
VTVVAFASVKGAPGVTTATCLVAATWPVHRKVAVVECDPSGADLAARFGLSSKCGWSSFATASRRTPSTPEIGPHLQQLPGGLDVLVGARSSDGGDPATASALVSSAGTDPDGPWDLLVDLGRLLPGTPSTERWLELSDGVALVVRSDVASVLQIRDGSSDLLAGCHDRVGLVVVPTGEFPGSEIERFTGLPLIGEIPFDPAGAAIATGRQGSRRRLSRSLLVTSAFRVGATLVGRSDPVDDPEDCPDRSVPTGAVPSSSTIGGKVDASRRVWNALRRRSESNSGRLMELTGERAREEASR